MSDKNYTTTKKFPSFMNNHQNLKPEQLQQFLQLQKLLMSIYKQNDLSEQQQQTRNSVLKNIHYIDTLSELVAVPMKPTFSFSSEPPKIDEARDEVLVISPKVSRKELDDVILKSANATTEVPSTVPNVIDNATTITLLQKMAQDDFVAGEISLSERYIERTAHEYGWQNTLSWLNNIYIDNYSNSAVLIGLMHCLSHFAFDDVMPTGQTMALGVLQHADVFVRDYAIRAFENWNDKEALPILRSLSCDAKWLQEYVDKVIKSLEEAGGSRADGCLC